MTMLERRNAVHRNAQTHRRRARPSRRGAAHWARPAAQQTIEIDVLIPTADRGPELAVTLSGLAAQDNPPFVVIASHFDDAEHREHAIRAGADAFVSKLAYIHDVMPVLERLAGEGASAGRLADEGTPA